MGRSRRVELRFASWQEIRLFAFRVSCLRQPKVRPRPPLEQDANVRLLALPAVLRPTTAHEHDAGSFAPSFHVLYRSSRVLYRSSVPPGGWTRPAGVSAP